VGVVRALVRFVLRLFGVDIDADAAIMTARDEIVGVITQGHTEGGVQKEDRDRLLGALDLGDRTVEEIMLHRSNIEMIDAATPPAQILDQCLASRHTRLPVFEGEPENIIGLIHSKDMLRTIDRLVRGDGGGVEAIASFDVREAMMEPYFVPETTTLDDQMREFLRRHTHFALVVDEYGALQGLITLEDILEEIVGEITDEFDQPDEPVLTPGADGSYLIDGAMTIRDLNRATDWNLPDEEANTVAGLVIHEAQSIPNEGQVFSFHGFRFEVLARKANRITQLRIRPLT
jgi:Mg2+/Co2+ transporter CorB